MEWDQVRLFDSTPCRTHDPLFDFDCPQYVELTGSPQTTAFLSGDTALGSPSTPDSRRGRRGSSASLLSPSLSPESRAAADAALAADNAAWWSAPRPFHEPSQTAALRRRAMASSVSLKRVGGAAYCRAAINTASPAPQTPRTKPRRGAGAENNPGTPIATPAGSPYTTPRRKTGAGRSLLRTPASRVKASRSTARKPQRPTTIALLRARAANTPSRRVRSGLTPHISHTHAKPSIRFNSLRAAEDDDDDDDDNDNAPAAEPVAKALNFA
ncbi:uncharacterized protein AMSG_01516 [Thecamonas trahens ATCC 50062]|uniref:Uncharacterized protein n=1 Tax=Thecamonas trahens ATCC 50062 TaxID=461836 RepID=A0A0L0DQW9_THETB|nr:hypothetical protein AMSG_01516 [Thecamonas trahens ATCC 50062]KNC54665.1 hypothetical protein AMSG_01516 [Thecamonas trahens ATCC 50062]|eukprot:XP_013761567.1 hypothetical protein AMSG_01516 [Thecamonas trahens ATCC 50062]